MKIRTKIRFGAITTTGLVVIFIGAVFFLTFTLRQAYQKEQLAEKISGASFQMALFRQEYLIHPSERPKTQWIYTYEVLSRLLEEAAPLFSTVQEKELLTNTQQTTTDSKALFSQLIQNVEQGGSQTVIEELSNQLSVKAQTRISNALRLAELNRQQATDVGQIFIFVVIILGILVIGISIWSSMENNRVAESLHAVEKDFIRISAFDFTTTTTTTTTTGSQDEIGMMRRAFNIMVEKLKESYERLEEKIRERTRELDGKVNELEYAKKAMANILEDLEVEKTLLAESKAKDDALLQSIGDGIIATDESGKIIFINTSTEKILGWTAKEVIGKPISQTLSIQDEKGNDIAVAQHPMEMATDAGTTTTSSSSSSTMYYYVRKDKTKFPVAIAVTPVILDGKIMGAIGSFRDVTKEREIDRAKTEFVSLASHQLKTPLTTISWYAEMLQRMGKRMTKEQGKYVEKIFRNTRRMVDLVNALLNVSRLEMGTFTATPQPLALTELADRILSDLLSRVKQKKLSVEKNYDQCLLMMSADPQMMEIVLQNLLSNAIKYTGDGGKIVLKIEVLDGKILFTVTDTGCGIPATQKSQIFTKLFRADNAREMDSDGTGLGLYIVKAVVEQSGGKISFISEENRGTTFTVTLPIKNPLNHPAG